MEMAAGAVLMNITDTNNTSVAPLISFVIPQKGRLDLLERTLRSIAAQELYSEGESESYAVQVVVVTQDEHPDEACNLVERLLGDVEGIDFHCMVAQSGEATISTLRNLAARTSKGDLLAFLDADISLSANWVRSMTTLLSSDNMRVLVSAMQVVGSEPTVIEQIQVELNGMRVDREVNFLSGHNLLVSRETFEKVGGFPQHLMTCEDSVFTDRVGKLGTLFRSSSASYVHLGEDIHLKDVFRKEKWRSHSNLATLHGREVRAVELISFIAPMIVVFALALSLVAVLSGHAVLAIWLILLGLVPVLAYSFRLWLGATGRLSLLSILGYYVTYFVARGIGMTLGIGNAIRVRGASGSSVS